MQRQERLDPRIGLERPLRSDLLDLTSAAASLWPACLGLGVGELDEKGIW